MKITNITILALIFLSLTHCQQPNPPTWPSSVKLIDPTDSSAQSTIDSIFKTQGGPSPANNGQFSDLRFALLFKPGHHNLSVNVGFYT